MGRVTSAGRRLRAAAGQWRIVLVAVLVGGVLAATPTSAVNAAADPDVTVRINSVSPSVLEDGDAVTLAGTIRNDGDATWTSAQAYLVIPRTPFTTRQQVTDAVESKAVYTGERVVELDSIDNVGTLEPGSTRPFRVRVPYGDLGITGAEGVYPVGVQILATAEDGTRDTTAIARATTFMPLMSDDSPEVPGGLVWPFLLPDRIEAGRYLDPEDLVERVSRGGQLRNLLDQARSAPLAGTSIVLDPALLVVLGDLAEGRRLPKDVTLDDAQRAAVRSFSTDLVDLSRTVTCWTVGYARPDDAAVTAADRADELQTAIDRATSSSLADLGIAGRRVAWPVRATSTMLPELRGSGENGVIVTRSAVPDWEPREGSLVLRRTDDGPVPLLVDAGLDVGVPGGTSVATLRQRLLGEAAFASMERSTDRDAHSDAIVLVDPRWNPGPVSDGALAAALDADFVSPADLEELLTTDRSTYQGSMPRSSNDRPVSRDQVETVEQLVDAAAVVSTLVVDSGTADDDAARSAASLLSVAWRSHAEEGQQAAREELARTQDALTQVRVEGPPAFTLSSSEGTLPLTVSNDGDEAVRVGVRISTSNPALSVPEVEPVEVAAGERRTLNVSVNVGNQTSSTFTAQLVTSAGTPVGSSDSFNVRSSRVGLALWAAMGAAGLFVLFALGRRFLRGRSSGSVERGEPDE